MKGETTFRCSRRAAADRAPRKPDPGWANRRRRLRARERLSDRCFKKMRDAIVAEYDTGQIVVSALIAKEEVRARLCTGSWPGASTRKSPNS